MTAVAALESGRAPARPAGPHALTVASYVAGGALVLFSIALQAGFYNLRHGSAVWPPKGVNFDEYLSAMLTATLLLSAGVVAWAASAAKLGNRRQAMAGLALTIGLGAAFLNLAWYTGSHAGFGASSHPFGTVVITGLVVGSIAVVIGIGFLAAVLLRTQLRAEQAGDGGVGAATRFWLLVVLAWLVSPVALYGLMSPR
ncbi:MAG: cytochrome c oxidase subunit [Actinomycetota bacterium]|jgi:cytochrome c oxidase subunit 3